jgi:hypothetical protein
VGHGSHVHFSPDLFRGGPDGLWGRARYARRVTAEKPARGWFFAVRVTVLSLVLVGVLLHAAKDAWARRVRNRWDRTLDVAVVLVQAPGAGAVDPAAVSAFRARTPALAARFGEEHARITERHARAAPFRFDIYGLAAAGEPPPRPEGDGLTDQLRYAWRLRRWVAAVDDAANVSGGAYDARVYVVARRPESAERQRVEGRSEHGGWIGLVEVELDPEMADLALAVAGHELLHTLGAEDSYGASGAARLPEGFAEPERVPLYPQRFAEIMARGRPLAPGREAMLETLDELAVGRATARAIGWTTR